MLQKIKQVLLEKNTLSVVFWFSVLGFLRPALNVFLLPLYLNHLTPEDFGILSLIGVFTGIILGIGNLRLDTAMRVFYFDYNHSSKELHHYLRQLFSTVLILAMLWFSFFVLTGPWIFQLIFENEKILFFPYGIIALATGLLGMVNAIYFIYLKNQVRIRAFFAYSVWSTILTVMLQAVFVLKFGMKIEGVLLGYLIPTVLVFMVIVFNNRWIITRILDAKILKQSIRFSLPLIPFTFLLTLEKQLDKFFLEKYQSLEVVGLYAVLISLVGIVTILLTALNNGIRPYLYQALKDNTRESHEEVNHYFLIYIATGLLGLGGIIFLGNNLNLITDNAKYLQIQPYFILAAIGAVPMIFVQYFALIYIYYKKSNSLLIITFFKTLVMLFFLWWLIPMYGIIGAIVGVALSYVMNAIIFYKQVGSLSEVSVDHTSAFKMVAVFLIVAVGCNYLLTPISVNLFGLVQFLIIGILILWMSRNHLKQLLLLK